ncbi:hypothetical protein ACIQBJ_34860 [Kitasatospora sp. NPDC088391]|uniref:hypothetical protein n=1 Tax=Kitasatospora sp. NPDC088391 TaxID=3364074 RepID=UPI00382EE01F
MPQQREKFDHAPAGAVEKEGGRRLDLTVTQVAASALATVVGAVLASELGVYGTILGAAVVSVGATTGSALFQHLFKRTGEQLRNAVERGAESRTATPPGAGAANGMPADNSAGNSAAISAEWNAPQVLRAKRRWTWKSVTAVSALVFAVAMVPIVGVELAAGKPLHDITTGQDGGGGTSFNPSRPSGGGADRTPKTPAEPSPGSGSRTADPAPSPSPSSPASRGPVAPSRSPEPSGSAQPSPSAGGTPPAATAAPSAPAATPAGAEAPPTGGAAAG